jgi:PAS domain S-box-containing protein
MQINQEQDQQHLVKELESAREALIQQRYQHEMMLRWVEGAVLTVDRDGKITDANPVALRGLGWDLDELLGRECHGTIQHTLEDGSEYPLEFSPMFAALEDGSSHHVDGDIFWRKDGTNFSVDYIVCSTRNEKNEIVGAVLTFRNLTEKRLEEVKRIHGMKLEAIGQLSAGIAHEINTPMQFIGTNLAFLQEASEDLLRLLDRYREFREQAAAVESSRESCRELAELEEQIDVEYLKDEMPKAFSQTQGGVGRVTEMIQGLKGFAHADHADQKRQIDINTIIRNTLVVSRNEYKDIAGIETDLAALPDIKVHPGDIGQVILNLVVNAAHAIAARSKEEAGLTGCIRISSRLDENEVVIAVEDNGKGIADEFKNRVFDPFFTTKEVGQGSGQGLSISRNIIHDKHGGKLYFETMPGKGTTFFIRLPC